jgi:uncharacterized protein
VRISPPLLDRPADARALLVLAHGAGAGMRHPFMGALAGELGARRIATLRYEFPYMAEGRRRPDPPRTAVATVRAAVAAAADEAPGLPLFAGGKSFGGRMTTLAAAEGGLDVLGLVLVGFPLHPAGRPGTERARHLADVRLPMLFLQGTRDRLAEPALLEPVLSGLGERATVHVEEGADHGFHVLKRSGRTDAQVVASLAAAVAGWITTLVEVQA